MNHTIRCDECGCTAHLIYGGSEFGWTGVCNTCKAIYMFVDNDEVRHCD